ncbi:hypothetical protein BCR33DRAFT_400079 [Rhizoclosmatium globosum]|uniref:Uncharacterized protein n=1 Tax=Rhizoclosmatium globosum TaxID=329046 RepID=A0A1Y2CZW2_9FUNG|nr:hypothetical protein BCR33DRAFT_400079 [Rhizoclosmatium globosum]|eukprot:ORY51895.1 hypothetical protein BCR33DRAFT_400079 [Rhizoclosmatium globosum]
MAPLGQQPQHPQGPPGPSGPQGAPGPMAMNRPPLGMNPQGQPGAFGLPRPPLGQQQLPQQPQPLGGFARPPLQSPGLAGPPRPWGNLLWEVRLQVQVLDHHFNRRQQVLLPCNNLSNFNLTINLEHRDQLGHLEFLLLETSLLLRFQVDLWELPQDSIDLVQLVCYHQVKTRMLLQAVLRICLSGIS